MIMSLAVAGVRAQPGPSASASGKRYLVTCRAHRSSAPPLSSSRTAAAPFRRGKGRFVPRAGSEDAAITPSEVLTPVKKSDGAGDTTGMATREFDTADLVRELVEVDSDTFGKRGELWVLAQFIVMGLLIFPPRQLIWMGSFTEAACIICGLLLVYGGVTDLKGNLTPLPTPRANAELVTTGAYSIVRHPIYTGVLLMGLGVTLAGGGAGGTIRIPLLALLYYIFDNKASLEEKALSDLFPGQYEEYARRVPRMVPSLAAGALDTMLKGLKLKQ